MPVLSHLHQLFNADQCQTYIHTLRWKDAAVERSSTAMSSLPELPHWTLGHVPIPPWVHTLLVP